MKQRYRLALPPERYSPFRGTTDSSMIALHHDLLNQYNKLTTWHCSVQNYDPFFSEEGITCSTPPPISSNIWKGTKDSDCCKQRIHSTRKINTSWLHLLYGCPHYTWLHILYGCPHHTWLLTSSSQRKYSFSLFITSHKPEIKSYMPK
jgi:hypothetical protein